MGLEIKSQFPDKDQENVEINTEPSCTFSNEIDPLSVSEDTVKISPAVPNAYVFVHPTEPKKVVLCTESDLDKLTKYTVTFTKGIEDMDMNHLQNDYSWVFMTGNNVPKCDETPPAIKSTYPKDLTQDVSISTSIEIVFSKRMDPLTINPTNIKLLDSRLAEILTDVSRNSLNLSESVANKKKLRVRR